MARLSLCLIARDEEELLPGCLASVAGLVDEVVVADTGSCDGTARIAQEAGARVLQVPWRDDFSEPRNATLAAATGDFVLVLDADERLAPGSGPALRAALDRADFDCGMVWLHNAAALGLDPAEVILGAGRLGPPQRLPRVLRRTGDLRYTGVIHESVSDWLAARGMRVALLEVNLVHFGAVPELRAARNKRDRNLGLLRRRCALEPENVTPFGYLALELASNGELAEALEVAERGWALLPRQPADRSLLRLAIARAMGTLWAEDPVRALDSLAAAERVDGPQPDLDHLRGRALLLRALDEPSPLRDETVAAAEAAFRRALAAADAPRHYLAGSSSWASWCGVGHALLWRGQLGPASEAFEQALAVTPDCAEARLGQAELLLCGGRPDQALGRLERLLDSSPDGWTLAAQAAIALGAEADARMLESEARKRTVNRFRAPHRQEMLARLRARLGQPRT
jgi:tetratricopeptide (TPR) repeat protein